MSTENVKWLKTVDAAAMSVGESGRLLASVGRGPHGWQRTDCVIATLRDVRQTVTAIRDAVVDLQGVAFVAVPESRAALARAEDAVRSGDWAMAQVVGAWSGPEVHAAGRLCQALSLRQVTLRNALKAGWSEGRAVATCRPDVQWLVLNLGWGMLATARVVAAAALALAVDDEAWDSGLLATGGRDLQRAAELLIVGEVVGDAGGSKSTGGPLSDEVARRAGALHVSGGRAVGSGWPSWLGPWERGGGW